MKTKLLFRVLIPIVVSAILVSCGTSNRVASNFGKRKYTKGYFSDPVAKVKTVAKPTTAVATKKSNPKNSSLSKITLKDIKANLSAPSSSETARQTLKEFVSNLKKTISTSGKPPVTKTASSAETKNESMKSNLVSPSDSQASVGSNDGSHLDSHRLLMLWLILLGASILCYIIAAVSVAGAATSAANGGTGAGGVGLAVIFWILGALCSIAALVFFIMWLVSLAS